MNLYSSGLALALGLTASQGAMAYQFQIDEFLIGRDRLNSYTMEQALDPTWQRDHVFFDDTFADGAPPPTAPNLANGNPISYATSGAFGPESGGQLTLDSAFGEIGINPVGTPRLANVAVLATEPTSGLNGLKSNFAFSIGGIYKLMAPSQNDELYGVQLRDRIEGINEGDDVITLAVNRSAEHGVEIQLQRADYINDSLTDLYSAPIDANAAPFIYLALAKPDKASNVLGAAYAYMDEDLNLIGPLQILPFTTTIFNGEGYTLAGFAAVTNVPEPGQWAMMLAGMGLIGVAARLRRKQA